MLDHAFKYEQVANLVEGMIATGHLAIGAKAPSLRKIADQSGCSMSVAIQAYRVLEDRGILECRPKSGFFVSSSALKAHDFPVSQTNAPITKIARSGSIQRLLVHASDQKLMPFGCAIPSTEVLASGRLDKHLARAARIGSQDNNLYTVPRGHLPLRQQLAKRALNWGQLVDPQDLVVTCGCTEALFLALKLVTKAGDLVAVESPVYFGLLQLLENLDLRVIELPADPVKGVTPERLAETLTDKPVKACILSSGYSNPLGSMIPEEDKIRILEILAGLNIPLIEDDVYGELGLDQKRGKPFMALNHSAEIFYCSSLSKTLAPGYRIGWLHAPSRIEQLLELKLATTLSGAVLPQMAVADYLSGGGYDHHLRRIRKIFAHTLHQSRLAIETHFPAGTAVSQPRGGFVLWIAMPEGCDSRLLFERALEQGICFAPGEVFSASDQYRNYLRISCGHRWEEGMQMAIATLGQLAGDLLDESNRI